MCSKAACLRIPIQSTTQQNPTLERTIVRICLCGANSCQPLSHACVDETSEDVRETEICLILVNSESDTAYCQFILWSFLVHGQTSRLHLDGPGC